MSTVGSNITNLLFKCNLSSRTMYQSTHASVATCVAVIYDSNVSNDDKIYSGVLRECINIMRDNTSQYYHALIYYAVNCIIDYVALA